MKYRPLAALIAILLLSASLAACGGGPGNEASRPSPDSPSSSALEGPEASPPSPRKEVQEATPSAEPEQTAEPSPAEKAYRMNDNYVIVPIDKEATDGKVVLLTFDDGPKAPETLDPILDTLDKHRAKAIFFVNGYRVEAKPDLLRKIDERGQTIGNHSWDHIDLKKEQVPEIKEQIESVQSIVREITGKSPVFFRPPHGSSNEAVRKIARENGLLFMTWSNGSLDWSMGKIPEGERPRAVVDNVLEQLHSGSNILMHELPWTAAALDDLLSRLEEKGYSFVDPDAIDTELQ
ncbi:polysaccharide deacetylase family protein [Paenibacillaceae bacterium WGS1546]|uniref:polysaccharide deacetylase family protein n=1 Tax=Cohnella sp. WGS1546 TaxID=3366810 RepID=UPI00372D191F